MAGMKDGISSGGGGVASTTGTFSGNVTLGDASGDAITCTGTLTVTPTAVFTGGVTLNNDSTTAADKDILFGTTGKAIFGDATNFIHRSSAGVVTLTAATTLALSGAITSAGNIRMATTKKVEFTDANVYLNASAASKAVLYSAGTGADAISITTGASGTVAVNQNMSIGGDLTLTGHKQAQTIILPGHAVRDDSATILWIPEADGVGLAASQTAEVGYLGISGLKIGDELVSFKLIGTVTSGGNQVTVDCKLSKCISDGTNSDITNGAITQVDKTAGYTMDEANNGTMTVTTVATDTVYYFTITATTGAGCTANITAIELLVNRK